MENLKEEVNKLSTRVMITLLSSYSYFTRHYSICFGETDLKIVNCIYEVGIERISQTKNNISHSQTLKCLYLIILSQISYHSYLRERILFNKFLVNFTIEEFIKMAEKYILNLENFNEKSKKNSRNTSLNPSLIASQINKNSPNKSLMKSISSKRSKIFFYLRS